MPLDHQSDILAVGSSNYVEEAEKQAAYPNKAINLLSEKGPLHSVYELSGEQLSNIRIKAISVGNFAVLCMREMFTIEKRLAPNTCISGMKGKHELDHSSERLDKIYQYVLEAFAISDHAVNSTIKPCNICMDKGNSNLKFTITRRTGI